VIELRDDAFFPNAVRRLESFSHVWVVFVFHEHDAKHWKPSIRPPRLGGAEKVGVLASRSPHRPNPIGLSACKLDGVEITPQGRVLIRVSGVDILDGSPILDIKPYLPYADSIPEADPGWAVDSIERVQVRFTELALEKIAAHARVLGPAAGAGLQSLIESMVALDPRPAFQKRRMPPGSPEAEGTRFGFKLLGVDVQWRITTDANGPGFEVFDLLPG
jgi:tRNA-Thr(GGU) m(6)t(6)A37 methyltransferase TsaA